MIVRCYITMAPGGDRPYISTSRPAEDRMKSLHKQGCKVYAADILIPGWTAIDGRVEAIATEITDAQVQTG